MSVNALDRIRQFPEATPQVFMTVRRAALRRFPYGVFYQMESDYIDVVAVYHCRRDPKKWRARA